MKDHALALIEKESSNSMALNVLREYLQAYILRILHTFGAFNNISFMGGTALRFLHQLPRYSEDLDFSLENSDGYNFEKLVRKVKQELHLAGYKIEVSYNDSSVVHNAMIKFQGLLCEANLSSHESQNLSIKVEIDSNPPLGAESETHIINKYFAISFLSYNLQSLFAGKLHAIFSRKFIKGRDYYDLAWYLSRFKDIEPNISLLNNSLAQDTEIPSLTVSTWRQELCSVVDKVSWEKVIKDVEVFLERPSDLDIYTKENILGMIGD